MDGKVKVGVIGTGSIANIRHIPTYMKNDECVLWSLCDINPTALKTAADKYGVPAERCYTNYLEMLDKAGLDAVDICTPNYLHCEMIREAARRRMAFSTEKPMGITYRETVETYELVRQADVPSFICYSWRYRPNVRLMKELLEQGAIGTLHQIYVTTIKNSGLWPGRKLEWRFQKELSGTGGVLFDLNSHMVDITRYFGEEIESVQADAGIVVKEREKLDGSGMGQVTTDDWCNILARTERGVGVNYRISRTTTCVPNIIQFELFGDRGRLNMTALGWGQADQSIELNIVGEKPRTLTAPERLSVKDQMDIFIDMVKGRGKSVAATIEDGVISQRVLMAELKAVETGRRVYVSEINE